MKQKKKNFFSPAMQLAFASIIFFLTVSSISAIDRTYRLDFDNDGLTDIAVYREGTSYENSASWWYILNSRNNQVSSINFGWVTDYPVPADYDGDNICDLAVFRWFDPSDPEVKAFLILQSRDGFMGDYFGEAYGPKLPRNYDTDRKAQAADFRRLNVSEDPENPYYVSFYFIQDSNFEGFSQFTTGSPNWELPAPGDYDNDGISDPAVFDTAEHKFHVWLSSTNHETTAEQYLDVDYPVPGDYDGDLKTDYAGIKKQSGYLYWVVKSSATGSVSSSQWGLVGDIPVPGYYDGDTKTDLGVYRKSTGTWHILKSADNSYYGVQFGISTDNPTPQPFFVSSFYGTPAYWYPW